MRKGLTLQGEYRIVIPTEFRETESMFAYALRLNRTLLNTLSSEQGVFNINDRELCGRIWNDLAYSEDVLLSELKEINKRFPGICIQIAVCHYGIEKIRYTLRDDEVVIEKASVSYQYDTLNRIQL